MHEVREFRHKASRKKRGMEFLWNLFHQIYKHLIATKEFYDRHGGFTIVIARFIPIIRTFAPVVAGVEGMEYRRFIFFNVFGGIGWVLTTTFAGYFLGIMVPNIQEHMQVVIAIVIFLSLLPAITKFAGEKRRARRGIG